MNQVHLTGRLVRDPTIKVLDDDKQVSNFTIAVPDKITDSVDYIDCSAWGKTARQCPDLSKKGK